MQSYSLLAPGKINLYLEIIGDRADGFHELVMVLQSIKLADRIDILAGDTDDITIFCNDPQVPTDETNLAYRAAKLMCDTFPDVYANYGGVKIAIEKNIPVAAGLAGGSADAAAVLVGIDLLWNLGLTQPEIQELAANIGSDIPFCVRGGTAIATGRGEKLAFIGDLDHLWVVLAKYRYLNVSTSWAYNAYRREYSQNYISNTAEVSQRSNHLKTGSLVQAIMEKNNSDIGNLLYNDLEKIVIPANLQIEELKDAFANTDTCGFMMSGSGSTVFALFETAVNAQAAAEKLKAQFNDPDLELWVTKLSSIGIQVVN